MTVTLMGIGCGTEATLTGEVRRELEQARLIIGARRMLEDLPPHGAETRIAYKAADILEMIQQTSVERVCVVYSGDTGFYSGAKSLLPLLQEAGIEARVMPGISSVQYFAARLGQAWQDWHLVSAHGVDCDPVGAVMQGKPAFFLLGSADGPARLCQTLTEAGLGALTVTVGENLSYENETICTGTAAVFAERIFAPLCVMLTDAAPIYPRRAGGIPDEEFIREQVPMTKQEVRCTVLAKLAVGPEDICWDVGAGTGSVSVELAHHSAQVWAAEKKPEAYALAQKNREKFRAWNLHLVQGDAPDVLEDFPAPDAVFVGGSGGELEEILCLVHRKNPRARVCVSAIALETLATAARVLDELGYNTEICQMAVSRTRAVGSLHLLMAQNPVFLITGVQK